MGVAASLPLALSAAPSRDELHSLAQIRIPSWQAFVDQVSVTTDRTPPAYYLAMWLLKPLVGDDLWMLRLISVVAWGAAAVVLALILRRRGAPWPAVLGAGVVPSATGLMSMGSYARPYAVSFLAFAVALAVWDSSLATLRRRHLVGVWIALSLAVVLHYAIGFAALLVVVGEQLARRRDPTRRWAMSLVLLGALWTIPLNLVQIDQSLDALRALPRHVGALSVPGWYASTLRPLIGSVVVGALALAWWRVRRRGSLAGLRPTVASFRSRAQRWAKSPLPAVSALLFFVLPTLVVMVTAATSGAFLNRYALSALAGLAVGVGLALAAVGRRCAVASIAAAALLVSAVPFALHEAADDRPSRSWADSLATELRLPETTGPVVVAEEYAFSLLRRSPDRAVGRRVRLGSNPTIHGLRAVMEVDDLISGQPLPGWVPSELVLVIDPNVLADIISHGQVEPVEQLGSVYFTYQDIDRTLVTVVVRRSE